MKKIAFSLALLLVSSPVFAADPVAKVADSKTPVVAATDADLKERQALAAQFQKIRPIKDQVDASLLAVAANLAPEARDKFVADMKKYYDYKKVEDFATVTMGQVFTAKELKAMIAYYSSPEGKSAADKLGTYQNIVAPAIASALDAALTRVKYGDKK